ncbi:MAG: hypothetical protein M1335_00945 [Chloroflexi bacterium]|nr:hypothetical protein [Chloroflexota bacterium]
MGDDVSIQGAAKFTTLTCLRNAPAGDPLVAEIKADMEGKPSILAMVKGYMEELKGDFDNDALPYRKLRRLFELGFTPDRIEGHHYGVAIGLRTGDLQGIAAEYGNLLGVIWGDAIGGVCPWVGKSFSPMGQDDLKKVAGEAIPAGVPVFRGINHFNLIEHAPVNVASNALLTLLWHLQEVPDAERQRYGHERNGGHFTACRAFSIYNKTPREVFLLNYRYPTLGNSPPLPFLIDEVVEIADGLYLGQLVFATVRLLDRYDPKADKDSYHYRHFGYFLLFREEWNAEAKRLFPHLEMPDAAVPSGTPSQGPIPTVLAKTPDKFKTLTLGHPPDGDVDSSTLDEVRADLSRSETITHLLKSYSDILGAEPDTRSPVFSKLHTLFNAGIGPTTMNGFYRGANITFQSQGLLSLFNVNTLNIVWHAARYFSPWTGKRFDPIDATRLSELTGGYEKMGVPTSFGANTVVFRTHREKFVRKVIDLAGMWIEDATDDERKKLGYEAKTFFFIGKQAISIMPENKGKVVYQFNYRWKGLRTPPPDNFCVDELVQIADGLYLGQLIYATEILRPWDPGIDPFTYNYKLFGYFLLMDEEWHARRLRIGFDLDNV